jgi:hypothetical protein
MIMAHMTPMAFDCNNSSVWGIIENQKGGKTYLRGIGADEGWFFVKQGARAERFPNRKLANDSFYAKDAGLPSEHKYGTEYSDKERNEHSRDRGVGSGLTEKDSNVRNVATATGTVLTQPKSEHNKLVHAEDDFDESVKVEAMQPEDVENVAKDPAKAGNVDSDVAGDGDDFDRRF